MSLKSKELYDDYLNILINYIDNEFERKRAAKECALKAADEALYGAKEDETVHLIYWENVKKELL